MTDERFQVGHCASQRPGRLEQFRLRQAPHRSQLERRGRFVQQIQRRRFAVQRFGPALQHALQPFGQMQLLVRSHGNGHAGG